VAATDGCADRVSGGAVALVLLSAALHAGWSLAIKGSRDPLAFNVLQAVGPMLVGGAAVAGSTLGPSGLLLPASFWWGLAVTSAAHALYFFWMTLAYERTDLSVAYPIIRSTPALLPLVALPVLGEVPTALGALGIAVTVAGMWLVHGAGRPGLDALLRPGTGYAYLTLSMTVAYSLADKWVMADLDAVSWESAWPRALFFLLAIELGCGVLFVPLALRHMGGAALPRLRACARAELPTALGAMAISAASYGLILEALRSAPAGYVVAVRQASVVFVLLGSLAWLREPVTRPRALGALATVAGVALVGLRG